MGSKLGGLFGAVTKGATESGKTISPLRRTLALGMAGAADYLQGGGTRAEQGVTPTDAASDIIEQILLKRRQKRLMDAGLMKPEEQPAQPAQPQRLFNRYGTSSSYYE